MCKEIKLSLQELQHQCLYGKMTPEEVLNSVTEGINADDLDSLMSLYEPLTCFASQPWNFSDFYTIIATNQILSATIIEYTILNVQWSDNNDLNPTKIKVTS